jgi:hypothetical protein
MFCCWNSFLALSNYVIRLVIEINVENIMKLDTYLICNQNSFNSSCIFITTRLVKSFYGIYSMQFTFLTLSRRLYFIKIKVRTCRECAEHFPHFSSNHVLFLLKPEAMRAGKSFCFYEKITTRSISIHFLIHCAL